ncbi:MAG TPA: MBL fold metallo-hydrolase [Caulobacteraceae bacterium]|jgi:phosphoribosyl 1,2-cyclic phosphate phosphodiesterase|nr:MBL fold metallo-hydrolase [Caulobacteraceae bacterium]
MSLEVTILGCGSSGGVPRADGNWGACDPADPRNRRSRCSLLVRRVGAQGEPWTTVVVDTAPDFRLQAAAAGIERVDGVIYTHDHADQTHGIDDLRVFAGRMARRAPCFMSAEDHATLTHRFAYIFNGAMDYPAICDAVVMPAHGTPWSIDGPSGELPIITFPQVHGPIMSAGVRFGDVAYSSDVSQLTAEAMDALRDLDLWIVDALRWKPHPTHSNVQQALDWIAEVKPRRAVLTNMHVDLDYAELARQLPAGVEPAFDGWRDVFPLAVGSD